MKIVSVCACTSGIAHTYIAKEKLIRAAESMGHTIKVETQGTIGTEDELTAEEIKELADQGIFLHYDSIKQVFDV